MFCSMRHVDQEKDEGRRQADPGGAGDTLDGAGASPEPGQPADRREPRQEDDRQNDRLDRARGGSAKSERGGRTPTR